MALPLCGRRARGKPWRGRGSGRLLPPLSSLSTGGFRLDRLGFHDSFRMWPRRSSGNGGKPSQPQPEPDRAGRLRAARRMEAKGRAADEAAVRRKLRACPLADAKAACFVKRPSVTGRPSGRQETGRPTPDLRIRDRPGGKRDFGPARRRRRGQRFGAGLVGQDRVSARLCATATRISVHGRQAEPRLRPRIPPSTGPKLRPRNRDGGKRDASSEPPTANRQGFGPGRGARGETGSGFGRKRTPEERRREPPVRGAATRNRPTRDALPPRPGSSNGTVGAGGNAGPHYLFGPFCSSPARGGGPSGAAGWWRGGRKSAPFRHRRTGRAETQRVQGSCALGAARRFQGDRGFPLRAKPARPLCASASLRAPLTTFPSTVAPPPRLAAYPLDRIRAGRHLARRRGEAPKPCSRTSKGPRAGRPGPARRACPSWAPK
jgi:hypothetical protein